jgi:hypothetical protein
MNVTNDTFLRFISLLMANSISYQKVTIHFFKFLMGIAMSQEACLASFLA